MALAGVVAAPPDGTQSIRRALSLLSTLADQGELTITALAAAAGLNPATAARMIKALVAEGMVRRNPVTDGYQLGARLALLGQAAQRMLGLDKALPAMRDLAGQTHESVNLSIREGMESVVLLRVQSTLPLRFEQTVGARFPLYSTASGKALLAFSGDLEDYVAALPERLPPVAPGTLATRNQLRHQLIEIQERGYSIDIGEENVEGVRCVGAPVLDESGRAHAAVVLQAPAIRMRKERILQLGTLVKATAAEVAHVVPDHDALGR